MKLRRAIIVLTAIFMIGCGSVTDDQYDAPSDLELTTLSDGKIKLDWSYSTQSTSLSYVIARKEGESEWDEGYGTTEDKEFIDEVPANSFDVYRYKVSAFDADNESYTAYSIPVAFFTDLSHPTSLEISQTSQSFLQLDWEDNSLGEEGYKIDKKIGEGNWQVGYQSLPANTSSFTDSVETLYSSASYRVYAFVNESYSNVLENQVVPSFPAPTNIVAEQVSTDQIRVLWEDISDGEEGFRIEKKIGYGEWEETAAVTNGSNEFLDYLTTESGSIYYRIYAFQGDLISAYSEVVTVYLNIKTVSETMTEHRNLDFEIQNNMLFVAADYDGVKIYDVSNQEEPILHNTISLPGRTQCITLDDTLLVAGSNDGYVYYYSIHNIDTPFEIGKTSIIGTPYDIVLDGNFSFVAAGEAGILTLEHNLEYYDNPIVTNVESTSGTAMKLHKKNNYLYLADGIAGAKLFQINNNAELDLITVDTSNYVNDILSMNNVSVLSYGEEGIGIFDEMLFSEITRYDSYGYIHSLNYAHDNLYFYDIDRGCVVLDVREVDALQEIAALAQTLPFNTIRTNGGYMYCGGDSSMKIIQIVP